jgi:hypothetical protein
MDRHACNWLIESPDEILAKDRSSVSDGLEHATGAAEKLDISRLGAASYLVEPLHRRRFQARLGGTVGRVDHFNFHLHCILPPLDPAFPFLTSLVHGMRYSK